MPKFDTEYQPEITCPHCGKEDGDSWEHLDGGERDFETDCGWCSKPIRVSVHIEVTYSARPAPEKKPSALKKTVEVA